MTGPATVPTTGASGAAPIAPIRYWRRVNAPVRGFAPGPWYHSPWAWEAAFRADPIDYLLASFRTFGDVVCIRAVPFRSLFLAHPEHIKHVLQDNARNYVKGIVIAKMKVVIGEGLFTSEGDFWRRQRRLSQTAFHRDRLAGFATAMTETTAAMLDRWASRARSGAPFDVAADMSALTLGIVGRALFSRVLDAEVTRSVRRRRKRWRASTSVPSASSHRRCGGRAGRTGGCVAPSRCSIAWCTTSSQPAAAAASSRATCSPCCSSPATRRPVRA